MNAVTRETLEMIGFVDVAGWYLEGATIAYALDGEHKKANALRVDVPNALYAFVRDDAVQYIGKTTRGARKRLQGYRNPPKGQRTNFRCNARIKEALVDGAAIRILVFTPILELRYREFEINLAAGMEDALIAAFNPPWNGSEKGKPLTEEGEREKDEEKVDAIPSTPQMTPAGLDQESAFSFEITLGQAYYQQGIINPGVAASQHLGADGEPVEVSFSDGAVPVISSINRKASTSGAVRVVGRNRVIAEWFQQHFKLGEVVQAQVLDPNHIRLVSPTYLKT